MFFVITILTNSEQIGKITQNLMLLLIIGLNLCFIIYFIYVYFKHGRIITKIKKTISFTKSGINKISSSIIKLMIFSSTNNKNINMRETK